MKNLKLAFVGLMSTVVLSACSVTLPYTATNNPIGSKKGSSKTTILFGGASQQNLGYGLVLNKNYGVIEAAKKGKIERIATVDIKITNYIIFTKAEIKVTGE